MQRNLFATLAALALERLDSAGDILLWLEPRAPLRLAALAQALPPDGWLALAAVDPANRFHAALGEVMAQAPDEAPFRRLTELAQALSSSGFSEVELADTSDELRVLPTQDWLLRNAGSSARALAARPPAERAQVARSLAARLKDLWCEDAFRVPVAVRCVYARNRRIVA